MSALKSLRKKVLGSRWVRGAACWLVAQYIRFVWHSGRWQVLGEENFRKVWDANESGILCFWHGRLLMMPYSWQRPKRINMLISAHRDGELIANTVKHLGVDWVKGSAAKDGKSKGGAEALRTMLRALKSDEWVGITPDGPRGPRMRISDGVITIARMSGAAIMPLTFGVKRGKVLGSWDRFLLPSPFSSGVLMWGEPFYVPRDLDADGLEAKRLELEGIMNTMTAEADRMTGRRPIEPSRDVWERPA